MMNSSEWVLKVILSGSSVAFQKELEQFLSQEEKVRLDAMPSIKVNPRGEEPSLLEWVHWSWLLSTLEALSLKEQKLLVSALPALIRGKLCRALKIQTPAEERKRFQKFFLQTLAIKLMEESLRLLPLSFLPPTPLSGLLHMSKYRLVELIDFLSFVDLATELRQIVETKILKKIYSFLSEEEKKTLKKAANVPYPIPVSRLHLEQWDGTEKSFRLSLHKRGLVRFGAALSTQHPDFIWYICHQLDVGRGTTLAKLSATEVPRTIGVLILHQIEEFLK